MFGKPMAAREKQAEPPSVGVVPSGQFESQEMIRRWQSLVAGDEQSRDWQTERRKNGDRQRWGQVGMFWFPRRQRSGETRRGRLSQDRRGSYSLLSFHFRDAMGCSSSSSSSSSSISNNNNNNNNNGDTIHMHPRELQGRH